MAIAVTTNHATAVCQSGYQPIITSPPLPAEGENGRACIAHFTMIIWHNNQLHSIVFSGTKQIILSFRLGLVALPATCYLAPWQWPVTAARPLPSRSRGPLTPRLGPRARAPQQYYSPPMAAFSTGRRPCCISTPGVGRGPLLMRAPRRLDISGPWQILSELRSVASGPNGPPNRACRKRSRRLSTSSPRTGGPKRSWELNRAS